VEWGALADGPVGDGSMRDMCQDLEDQLVGFLQNLKPVAPAEVTDLADGRLIHAVTDTLGKGDMRRCFRWYVIFAADDNRILMRYLLSMRADLAETPLGRILVDHFAEEVTTVEFSTEDTDADPLASLRDVDLDGRVVFRLPLLMAVKPKTDDPEMYYASFRDDRVTASMWVSYHENLILRHEDGSPADLTDQPELMEETLAPWIEGGKLERVAHGWLGLVVDADEDDHIAEPVPEEDADVNDWRLWPMRRHHWTYHHPVPGGFLVVQWLLMTPRDDPDNPTLAALVELLEKEIRAARFDAKDPPTTTH